MNGIMGHNLNLDKNMQDMILESVLNLLVARFSFSGELLQYNRAFQNYFHSFQLPLVTWKRLFVTDFSEVSDLNGILHVQSLKNDRFIGHFYTDDDSVIFVGERVDIKENQLVEQVADLSDGMSDLLRQLRREKANLKRAHREISRIASTDPLTGILNRRSFKAKAIDILKNYGDKSIHSALFFMDLDHFKVVNDTYGHDVGDIFIEYFTGKIVNLIRSRDLFCRWGGEEFILLVTGINSEGSCKLGERILEQTRGIEIKGIEHSFSVSIGISLSWDHNLDEMIKIADEACYRSKKSGRDRFTLC